MISLVTLVKQKSNLAHNLMEAEILRGVRGDWALTSEEERFVVNSQCFPGVILYAFPHEFIHIA